MIRIVSMAVALLLSAGSGAALADDSRATLMRRLDALIERQLKCEANLRIARQRLADAIKKPYLSSDERLEDWQRLERAQEAARNCTAQAAAELQTALAALEIRCLKDLDEAHARQASGDQAGVQKAPDDAATCVTWARSQRTQRAQLEGLKVIEGSCEDKARNTEEFMRSDVARRSYTREGGARTYRDQTRDLEMIEEERQRQLACATSARLQQAQIRTFDRELDVLLRTLQQVEAQLHDRANLRYDEFTTRLGGLSRDVNAFKTRHPVFLTDKDSHPFVGKILEAGDTLVRSGATWQRAAAVQDVAQRDMILREVSTQWQAFQKLVRETSGLVSPASGGKQ